MNAVTQGNQSISKSKCYVILQLHCIYVYFWEENNGLTHATATYTGKGPFSDVCNGCKVTHLNLLQYFFTEIDHIFT